MAPSTPRRSRQTNPESAPPTPSAEQEERPLLNIEESDVQGSNEPVEDPTPKILDEATYGYAAICVYGVEPAWNKYDDKEEANRPLDYEHAKKLSEYMKANLKIADAPNRLCITMSAKQIELSLRQTAIYDLYGESLIWYEDHKGEPEVLKKIKDKIQEIDQQIKSKVASN
jgi:hypothetical protein